MRTRCITGLYPTVSAPSRGLSLRLPGDSGYDTPVMPKHALTQGVALTKLSNEVVMRRCKVCSTEIPATLVLDGKRRNLANRKYCFNCSPFGAHNTVKKENHTEVSTCRSCQKIFSYDRAKGHRRSVCNTCLVNSRRPKRKMLAVQHKGGCCLVCKYATCFDALDFHHVVPGEKYTEVSKLYLAKITKLLAELDKCVLLCCRCHAEVHAGLISANELLKLEAERRSLVRAQH